MLEKVDEERVGATSSGFEGDGRTTSKCTEGSVSCVGRKFDDDDDELVATRVVGSGLVVVIAGSLTR